MEAIYTYSEQTEYGETTFSIYKNGELKSSYTSREGEDFFDLVAEAISKPSPKAKPKASPKTKPKASPKASPKSSGPIKKISKKTDNSRFKSTKSDDDLDFCCSLCGEVFD